MPKFYQFITLFATQLVAYAPRGPGSRRYKLMNFMAFSGNIRCEKDYSILTASHRKKSKSGSEKRIFLASEAAFFEIYYSEMYSEKRFYRVKL